MKEDRVVFNVDRYLFLTYYWMAKFGCSFDADNIVTSDCLFSQNNQI